MFHELFLIGFQVSKEVAPGASAIATASVTGDEVHLLKDENHGVLEKIS